MIGLGVRLGIGSWRGEAAPASGGVITALKRRMASGVAYIPLGPGVTPNASKDDLWRRQSAWSYLTEVVAPEGSLSTALQRRAAAGVPFIPMLALTPDAGKDAAWRKQSAWSYLAISAGDDSLFNVMDYGAVGDGVHDDTPAARDALAAAIASSASSVTIYWPTPPVSYSVCRQPGDPVWNGTQTNWPKIFNVQANNKTIRFLGDGEATTVVNCFMEGLTDPVTNWVNTGDVYVKIARFTGLDVTGTNLTVIFEDITFDGQAGYTGVFTVGGSTVTGDGWDITHKCVRITNGSNIHVILRGGATMRNWRGEIIWGGNHNSLVTLEPGATLTGSNASALSVTNCNVDQSTIGGAGDLLVYNGVENFAFDDEATIITNSFIRATTNGIVPVGLDESFCTITGNTFQNCNNAILASEGLWNLLLDDNDFNSCANGVIASVLNLYPGLTNGFGNWTISNNRQQGSSAATFVNAQGQTIQGFLALDDNTISAGAVLGGSFNATSNFTVNGTILNGGKDVALTHTGVCALWTNTVRMTVPELNSAGDKIDSFNGASSMNITCRTDLVALNSNTTVGNIELNVTNVANIPDGQIITFKRYGSDANWVLPADTWNDFSGDILIDGDPVVLIKSGGVLSEYAINSGDSFLLAADSMTTDESYTDGFYWCRPYDMANDFGAEGAALAAANGRYVWLMSSDHYDLIVGWNWGGGIWVGWSDDPAVIPTKWRMMLDQQQTPIGITGNMLQTETPWLVYNPDDLVSGPFYLYVHGGAVSDPVHGQDTFLMTSTDFTTWIARGISHATTNEGGHTGYQTIYRRGTGDWESWGLGMIAGGAVNIARFTSTDGLTFTKQAAITRSIGNRLFAFEGSPHCTINGQLYAACKDDDRTDGNGMYFTMLPIQADGDIDTADVNDLLVISPEYDGVYPGTGFVQEVSGYEEDGVYLATVVRGFFSDTALAPEDVTNYQTMDQWAIITDATAAAGAAPVGLAAACDAGIVSVTWKDVLPNGIYRVDTGSSESGPWTDQGDFTGGSATVSLGDLDALRYVRLTKLSGGVDQQSRIVPVWVSAASTTANAHFTRVATTGGDTSVIDPVWLDAAISWLATNSLTDSLEQWSDPRFGVNTTGNLVCYDLAATIHPRKRGDLRALTSGITRSANTFGTGKAGLVAAAFSDRWTWSNPDHHMNNIRRWDGLTVAVAYSRTNAFKTTFFTSGGDGHWCDLSHDNGSNSGVTFHFQKNGTGAQNVNATCDIATETANQVMIGVLNSAGEAKVRAGGNWGSTLTGVNTAFLDGQKGWSASNIASMGGGTQTQKYARSGGYSNSSALSQCEIMSIVIFSDALSDSAAVSLETLLDNEMA